MDYQIGPTIARLRREQRLTLEALAKRTGFTRGYLSKIERGIQTPPISTLGRIASALGVQITAFFDPSQSSRRCAIVRRNERRHVDRKGKAFGYYYETIAHTYPDKSIEPFIITLTPYADDRTIFSHPGEEMMFVLKGRMLFIFGEETHELGEGDCVYFDSGVPHRGECIGDEEAKVLAIIVPEKRAGK